jgi:hypothetical protein
MLAAARAGDLVFDAALGNYIRLSDGAIAVSGECADEDVRDLWRQDLIAMGVQRPDHLFEVVAR